MLATTVARNEQVVSCFSHEYVLHTDNIFLDTRVDLAAVHSRRLVGWWPDLHLPVCFDSDNSSRLHAEQSCTTLWLIHAESRSIKVQYVGAQI